LLTQWKGKILVLGLLGFVATDFIITITLSAADATAHIIENPFTPHYLHHPVGVTLFLIAILGAVFLKGFKEAIGIAVLLVAVYLALNLIIVGVGFYHILQHPEGVRSWKDALFSSPRVNGSIWIVVGLALLTFPKLALGLSGFETGVAVMPLVKGDAGDTEERPAARVRNTRRLLMTAALIMSMLLTASSFITTTLIPAEQFQTATATQKAGEANGRALSYLAHEFLGHGFGTAYDISTILILWFAGASAMAGLLNIVPRYLPRYGMAPDWTRATRPLVLVFTAIAFAITVIFKADVNAQGGAYATGVLVLMSSAAIAVTLAVWRKGVVKWVFLLIALVFCYTTVVNVFERPDGVKIALFFIGLVLLVSLVSRVWRTTELRVVGVELDENAKRFIEEASRGELRVLAYQCDRGHNCDYSQQERERREDNHIPPGDPVLFLEVKICDASEFAGKLKVEGTEIDGHRVLRAESSAVPNSIAAFLLYLRDLTGTVPHAYFSWIEGNPLKFLFRYLVFGEGDTAPVTREVLRQAEKDPARRPHIHVGE
jgi:hypothetical protein